MTASTVQWGRRLAVAAIVVQVPRLVLMALAGDHLRLPELLEGMFLAISGVGFALTLTGGNVYLAHVIGMTRRYWLVVPWLLVLGCTGFLLTPMQVASLEGQHLQAVLAGAELTWTWQATNVLAGELVAASCMLAALVAQRAGQQAGEQASSSKGLLPRSQQPIQLGIAQLPVQAAPLPAANSPAKLVPCRNGCGWTGGEMGERGHQKSCSKRKAQEANTSEGVRL